MNKEKLWKIIFPIIYWSDFFVIGTFVFFIITFWMAAGIDWNTVASVGDLRVWSLKTVFFIVYIFPLISFIVWFPWALMKKRKIIFFSDFTSPYAWVFAIILILTYFFANHYTFSNLTTNPAGFSDVGWDAYTLFSLAWIIFFLGSMFAVFISGIFLWPYRIREGFWYIRLGLEPVTWEEMLAKLEGN